MHLYSLILAPVIAVANAGAICHDTSNLTKLQNEARDMFYHGWNNYMQHAFPLDELRPLACSGLTGDSNDPSNIHLNDVLGGYGVTLLDSLDMFAMMGEQDQFEKYVNLAINTVDFNRSATVQVFETTIRAMGGLLSAHLYASVPRLNNTISGYNGELLELAYDLGQRLLPAFDSNSGIPHPRVNLRDGVVPIDGKMITETCASGAGSLLLEFGLLSRLTGDPRFEEVARRAFLKLWSRRSHIDLIGMSVDAESGLWQSKITGIGASIDSYYEYALKYYVLFGDDNFYRIFHSMYKSLLHYSYDGWLFRNIDFFAGEVITDWIDSLSAFFPGVQTLAGDLTTAIKHHLVYYKIWKTYGGIPERWSYIEQNTIKAVALEWYPLRPEFVESNYYLYQATEDPFFLEIGRQAMSDIQTLNRQVCGYAGVQDVRTGNLTDRMESFFLSETTKYLYLLFDKENRLNKEYSNFVFSTEAHPMWYDQDIMKHASVQKYPHIRNCKRDTEWEAFQFLLKGYRDDGFSLTSWLLHKLSSPTTNNDSPKQTTRPVPTKFVDETCEVWTGRGTWFSRVASWRHFYSLDSAHNFTSPSWIQDARARVDNKLACTRFADRYVWDRAQCVIPQLEMFEISFGYSEGHVSERPIKKPNSNGVLQIKNLSGRNVRILRKPGFNGPDSFEAIAIDGITIGNYVEVVDAVATDHSGIVAVIDGILHLQYSPVKNVKFLS